MSSVLVINIGSPTIKYQLLDVGDEGGGVLASGLLDRIGDERSSFNGPRSSTSTSSCSATSTTAGPWWPSM